jgi:N-methylhydantoinase A
MDEIVSAFEGAYSARYGEGSGYAEAGVILTALRVEARAVLERPPLRLAERARAASVEEAQRGERRVYWWEVRKEIDTPVLAGLDVPVGARVDGPAIIEFPDTTAVIRPGQSAQIDALGSLVVAMGEPTAVTLADMEVPA